MPNLDIATQLKAAQVAGDLIADKLENLTDPTQGPELQQQAGHILDQINRLQSMVMVARTADIAAQTPKVTAAKTDLQKLAQSDACVASFVNGVDSFLTVLDGAVQTAAKAMV
jgi:hypothetical protein